MVDVTLILQFVLDIAAMLSLYILLVLSLNWEYGYAGITNLGKMLFMATGGYTVATITPLLYKWALGVDITQEALQSTLATGQVLTAANFEVILANLLARAENRLLSHNPLIAISLFVASLIIAMVVGGVVGVLASFPAVRLRTDYLAISLLALAETTVVIGENYPPFNFGIQIPDPFIWMGGGFMRYIGMTLAMVLAALLVFLYSRRLSKSPMCRALCSMRDNQPVTEALGRNTTRLKMKVLFAGSAVSALAGALYGFYSSMVQYTVYNRTNFTFWPYLMLILGGAGNNEGAVIGCVIFVVARRIINFYKDAFAPFLPFDPAWLDYMILGLLLLIMLTRRPQGILPQKSIDTLSRSKLEQIRQSLKDRTGSITGHGKTAS